MHILPEYVDFLQKHHVLLHDSCILLFVDILILLEHLSEIVDAVFKILPPAGILTVYVEIACFILEFFFDIFFVQPYHTFA